MHPTTARHVTYRHLLAEEKHFPDVSGCSTVFGVSAAIFFLSRHQLATGRFDAGNTIPEQIKKIGDGELGYKSGATIDGQPTGNT
jgi:hypothetical protein